MTLFVQADPSREFDRLAATVLDWPLSNADDRKERWPKQLSRRLLPKTPHEPARLRLHEALYRVGIPLPQSQPLPPPPTSVPPQQSYPASVPSGFAPPPPPPPQQRHRGSVAPNPSQPLPDEDVHSSGDDGPAVKIERERKPYVAREGTGKVHDDDLMRAKSNTSMPPLSATQGREMPPPRDRDVPLQREREGYGTRRERAPSEPYARDFRGDRGFAQSGKRLSTAGMAEYDDERYYVERDRDRSDRERAERDMRDRGERGSRDDEERRYSKYADDYGRGRGVQGGSYAGNPPLGTGERRYG